MAIRGYLSASPSLRRAGKDDGCRKKSEPVLGHGIRVDGPVLEGRMGVENLRLIDELRARLVVVAQQTPAKDAV